MTRRKVLPGLPYHFFSCPIVGRIPIFLDETTCYILVDGLAYAVAHKGLHVHGYVIMPDHVHYLLSTDPTHDLRDTIRSLHSFAAHQIVEHLVLTSDGSALFEFNIRAIGESRGNAYKVWDGDNYPIGLLPGGSVKRVIRYIHNNPVTAGLVNRPEDWRFSSARNYELGDHSVLRVDCLSL